jgi:fructose-bisphosphate aldolase class I
MSLAASPHRSTELVETSQTPTLSLPLQGILASDESNATTGKRLESVGVENNAENR